MANDKKIGYIDGAFVDSDFQGQGVGGMLYRKATEYLWEQDCTALSAIVKDDNVGSFKLLLNNGFFRISLLEGVRQLGLRQMFLQYFAAPFFISNGMELYLAVKSGEIKPKQRSSVKQIALYIVANSLLLLFSLIGGETNFPVFFSAYIALLLGGILFGYIGTRFSKERWNFRLNSGGAVLIAFITALGGLYPMIAIYPFESYGGNRVYHWNKRAYIFLSAISTFVVIMTFCIGAHL